MSPLVKIRAERDQMSAIERRIADFMLDNAHLLRDYSSQQLADALRVRDAGVMAFQHGGKHLMQSTARIAIGDFVVVRVLEYRVAQLQDAMCCLVSARALDLILEP